MALEPGERAEALARVPVSEMVQVERVQAILNGVQLAAEQIQDVRIQRVEEGPVVKGSDVAVAMLLTGGTHEKARVFPPP